MTIRMLVLLFILGSACAVRAGEGSIPAAELRAAAERAIPLLEKGAVGHRENRTCFSCHQQGVPLLAMATAKERGLAVNEEELAEQTRFIAAFLESNRQKFLDGKGTGGQVDTAGYALLALRQGGYESDETTTAVTEYLLLFQKDADHWTNSSKRPPSEASEFTTTYLGLRGLHEFGSAEQQDRIASRQEQVRKWLQQATPRDTEDQVFRLLSLALLKTTGEELEAAVGQLRELQREDGGWAQTKELESDAYATGTALFALHQAGGMPTNDPVYQLGLRFLLKTQLEDGSWHVVSRSKPFQTYFETGFPHEKDQFISAAATAWATTALLLAIDPQ